MSTDDSICESSLPPNKSSGDIGELRSCPFCGCATPSLNPPVKGIVGFTGSINCPGCMASMPREIDDAELIRSWNTRTPDPETAAEIERLRRENKQCLALLEQQAIQITDGRTIYDSANRRALTAESAVAAAWEEAADWHDQQSELAMNSLHCGDNTSTIAAFRRSANWHTECAEHFRSRASAIRAAVSKKTAESGHSPSTHNSESE